MEKKKTAVDWLEKRINSSTDLTGEIRKWLLQAKQMEKIQIEEAYKVGRAEATMPNEKNTTGEQYYNEIYDKNLKPREIWVAISKSPLTGALKATTFQEIEGESWMEELVEEFNKTGVAEAGGLPVIKIIKAEI
jgi:hypothetical protein